MKLILYLDVFFFVNWGMNAMILTVHNKLLKGGSNWIRTAVAAALGAFGGCILLMWPIHNIILAILVQYVGIAYVLMWSMYGSLPLGRMSSYLLAFLGITIFWGGAIDFLGRALKVQKSSILFVLSCAFLLHLGVRFLLWRWSGFLKKERNVYSIEVRFEGRTVSGYGFYDTGNHLREPISGKPVVIAEYGFVKDLFSEELKEEIKVFPNYSKEVGGSALLRWIPYHSLGKQKGSMPGIEVEGIGVGSGEGRKWFAGVYLAIYMGEVSADHSYQFILNQECFA